MSLSSLHYSYTCNPRFYKLVYMPPCCFLQMCANAPTSPFLGSLPQSPGSRLRRRATFAISVSFFRVASRLPAVFTDVVPARMRAGIISAKSRILMLCSQAVCKCAQDTARNPSRYMSKRIVSRGGKGCASGERQWAPETADRMFGLLWVRLDKPPAPLCESYAELCVWASP